MNKYTKDSKLYDVVNDFVKSTKGLSIQYSNEFNEKLKEFNKGIEELGIYIRVDNFDRRTPSLTVRTKSIYTNSIDFIVKRKKVKVLSQNMYDKNYKLVLDCIRQDQWTDMTIEKLTSKGKELIAKQKEEKRLKEQAVEYFEKLTPNISQYVWRDLKDDLLDFLVYNAVDVEEIKKHKANL